MIESLTPALLRIASSMQQEDSYCSFHTYHCLCFSIAGGGGIFSRRVAMIQSNDVSFTFSWELGSFTVLFLFRINGSREHRKISRVLYGGTQLCAVYSRRSVPS
jgi:hypothetical protein